MNKRATSILLTGVLGLGGLTAGLVVAPAVAVAQSSETSTTDALSERVSRITQALSGLVGEGTISQEQADRVATTLAEQMPPRGHGGPGGGRHLGVAAEALGVTVEELRTALEGGQSLAGVAEDEGIEKQTLIDRLVAAATERIDAKVAAGDLTQAEADERKAGLVERVTADVEREGLPERGPRGGDRRAEPAPPATDAPS